MSEIKGWILFVFITVFVTGGFFSLGYIIDKEFAAGWWSSHYISPIMGINYPFAIIFGGIGVFFGIFFGYRMYYHVTIADKLEKDIEIKRMSVYAKLLDELEEEGV